jgi:hypothetical protein
MGAACLVAGQVLPAVVEVVLVAAGDHDAGEVRQDPEGPERGQDLKPAPRAGSLFLQAGCLMGSSDVHVCKRQYQ